MTSHQEEEVVTQEEETFPTTVPIENPPERTSTILSLRTFIQLRTQFGFAENDVLFPGQMILLIILPMVSLQSTATCA